MTKIAIITNHKYLPPMKVQRDAAISWGVNEKHIFGMDVSPIWGDDVSAVRTTNWHKNMPERASLLRAMRIFDCSGIEVFFYNILCTGLSLLQAKNDLDIIRSSGANVYVHKGVNWDTFDEDYKRAKKTSEVRVSRGLSN